MFTSFNETKGLVKQEFFSTKPRLTSNVMMDDLSEEINTMYKKNLKFNYLLVNGLAREVESIQDRQKREMDEACKLRPLLLTEIQC